MKIVKKISEINQIVSDLKKKEKEINLVPTMGNIHEGHLSLLSEAEKFKGVNIVSIFVNPAQFNDVDDFNNYPNTFIEDVEILSKKKCDIIFAPNKNEIFLEDIKTKKTVFEYRNILCDLFRLGHFDGVTTIVKILLDLIRPSNVFFGEKDFQQLKIIEQLINQNNSKTFLIKCPSIRDSNGMSLSSRYSVFSQDQRIKFEQYAKIINSNLLILKKNFNKKAIDNIENELRNFGISKIDYIEVRNEKDLSLSKIHERSRLFIALYLDEIRVIDNFVLY
ncbi:MAG: pantoate--beta-alanine ligase [Pelagibacteraceae bacterium]|jgi:pantoate--beta-alanine ligase|nr:pantoate--beta-alanine ligase [Pelagibacteraceae bacterium]MBT4645428.1 pantoate--beta-alanine ligase [Pelagibacteraceae bacterium]MBT5214365.1 pantoate--beta-alanine ligase [Pelagibacteraceae bacterium]